MAPLADPAQPWLCQDDIGNTSQVPGFNVYNIWHDFMYDYTCTHVSTYLREIIIILLIVIVVSGFW